MLDQFSRTGLLIGENGINILKKSKVIIFGIGGVGSYCAEALVRSGVEDITLVDNDKISITNINRQLFALHSTVGKDKVDVAKERLLDINPSAKITTLNKFYTPQIAQEFDFSQYDYIIDAIDTVSAKISLIEESKKVNVPIICAMGAGNKLDATMFEVADISKTSVCPLARVIRNELKKRNIKKVKVVYSKEIPQKPLTTEIEKYKTSNQEEIHKPYIPASIAFVPPIVGFIIAGEIIKDLIKNN